MMHVRSTAIGEVDTAADSRRPAALGSRVRRALRVLRTIIGAPDYERYVAHMRAHHPECEMVSRDEFMKQRLESRYSKPGSRCC
jgi:uncharacterized short protein YbdD (DUF466 family)